MPCHYSALVSWPDVFLLSKGKEKVTEREIDFKLLSSQVVYFFSVHFCKYFDRDIYEGKPRFLGGMEKHLSLIHI